ncbi:MAG: CapA family protein [Nitrospira sp.]|jgi:poly-gamma-glutamate synthesis protein (capsule biosynthesis protein)
MLGRLVDQYVIRNQSIGPDKIWSDVLPLLLKADRRLINLECVISDRGREWQPDSKVFHFRAHPRAIDFLCSAKVDCVTLADNHVLIMEQMR